MQFHLTASSAFTLLLVSALALLVVSLPAGWQNGLEFQHLAISGGELWRLFSGHLTHLSWGHLLMNLLGLWLIWALLLRTESAVMVALILLMLGLGTSLGLYLCSPAIAWYRGLSGVLHGLLVWGLMRQWRSQPGPHAIILGLVALKLAWEQFSGPLPGSATLASGRIVVEAHLYGALAGALLWAPQLGMDKSTVR
jgi:rhomboid family GlyGly-CTERM serine protease